MNFIMSKMVFSQWGNEKNLNVSNFFQTFHLNTLRTVFTPENKVAQFLECRNYKKTTNLALN